MTNTTGALTVQVGADTYRLWLGFSGLAELQAKHGPDFISRLQAPADAAPGWLPDFAIVRDLILEALQRHHADVADRWLVDELFAADPEVIERLFAAAFPDQVQSPGKRKRAAARS